MSLMVRGRWTRRTRRFYPSLTDPCASCFHAACPLHPHSPPLTPLLPPRTQVSLTHYIVTKIEGGSGPEHAGNDALASVAVEVQKMGEGEDAKLPSDFPGSSGLTFEDDGEVKRRVKSYSGTATSTDIVIASARAYIAALNRLLASEHEGPKKN